ncbi:CAAD domain-containing protein [Egbenema bharatensis]|uniref:CAAD domain-containing protein n=1 Tax=Egbenema bharatensis TaxID=3463334 RepID=UPI003A846667
MDPEVTQDTNSPEYTTEKMNVTMNNEDPGSLTKVSTPTNEQWKRIGERISEFLADLPEYLAEFFGEYRRPIITVSLVIGALIAVKLLLAVLDAINDIPLLSPLFELVGMGYTAWFVYRYVWKAENRQELVNDFNSLKAQVLGTKSLS